LDWNYPGTSATLWFISQQKLTIFNIVIMDTMVKGVQGVGLGVSENQPNMINSAGRKFPVKSVAWQLQLSPMKHVYLQRMDNMLRLVFKEFTDQDGDIRATGFHVTLDQQQTANLIFSLPDLVHTTRRSEIREVRKRVNIQLLNQICV
jgi:hypothetical protein